ncbi:MAG: hypothetical protein F6J87_29375 [Spirulina sp. SIO3F2]|nr:hypothetical protein [Spirulina sp. SIO3F2]
MPISNNSQSSGSLSRCSKTEAVRNVEQVSDEDKDWVRFKAIADRAIPVKREKVR